MKPKPFKKELAQDWGKLSLDLLMLGSIIIWKYNLYNLVQDNHIEYK